MTGLGAVGHAEIAARAAAAVHVETAVRLADEMVEDPTSMDLPRLVDAHARASAARDYALAVWHVEVTVRAQRHDALLREATA